MNTSTIQRINISLPVTTLELLDKITEKGDRSRFIDTAVRHFVDEKSKKNINKLLKEGAIKRSARDLAIAKEWFPIEYEW